MDVQISNGDKWKRHLEISLTSTEFKPHVEKTLRVFQKQARLDGFRPGKVPMHLVEKLFSDEARRKAIEELVPNLLAEVREQHRLRTVGPAQLDEVKIDENDGLKLRATVEVEPVAELKSYSGFTLDQAVYEVTVEDVEEVLGRLREQHSWLESVESGAQPGHLVTVDIQVTDAGGVPLIGRHHKDQRFRIAEPDASDDDFTPPSQPTAVATIHRARTAPRARIAIRSTIGRPRRSLEPGRAGSPRPEGRAHLASGPAVRE